MRRLEAIKAALAEFQAADAELWRIIRAQRPGEAGRLEFESALAAAVAAGERLEKARALQ